MKKYTLKRWAGQSNEKFADAVRREVFRLKSSGAKKVAVSPFGGGVELRWV